MNILLFSLIIGFSMIMRKGIQRSLFMLFGLCFISHSMIFDPVSGADLLYSLYFLTDALLLAVIIKIINDYKRPDSALKDLSALCFLGIVANIGGLILWYSYFSGVYYNVVMNLIYLDVLAVSIPWCHHGLRRNRGISGFMDNVYNSMARMGVA